MAKAKISSKDFLNLLDEQNDQPSSMFGSGLVRTTPKEELKADIPRTKLGQTSDEPRNTPRTKLGQTSDEPRTESPSPAFIESETSDKPKTQLRTLHRTKLGQTSDEPRTDEGFLSFVGLQRRILLFIYDQCTFARDKLTDPISIGYLGQACETTVLSAQKTIQRLEKKNALKRASFRNGRGGWTRYELSQSIFQEVLHLETQGKLRTNLGQSSDKPSTQPRTQLRTTLSSSSSYVLEKDFKTTTTGEPEILETGPIQLSPEWVNLDLTPLTGIGFTQNHLTQIIRQGKLTPEETQDSIHFFAFDLEKNEKGRFLKAPPINFFMGILRKGMPYAPPENYESAADEARRKTREFKARKERERQDEDQKLLDLDFSEWRRGIAADELAALLPEYARKPGPIQDSALKTHFETNVWPERSQEFLRVTQNDRTAIAQQIEESLGGNG